MRGHIVYEADGRRFVLLPRDKRLKPRCYHCALFTQRRGDLHLPCPVDGAGNKVCDYGQGFTLKWIPPQRAQCSGVRGQGSGSEVTA